MALAARDQIAQMESVPTRMEVRVEELPEGDVGIWLQIGETPFLFPLDAASRLISALEDQVELAREIEEVVRENRRAVSGAQVLLR